MAASNVAFTIQKSEGLRRILVDFLQGPKAQAQTQNS